MVSLPTRGTSLRFTASSTTSRTVQRARPSGGSLQTMAMMRCFWAIVQHFRRSRPLLFVEGTFEAALLVAMTNLANRLWS